LTILDTIIASKHKELALRKAQLPLLELEKMPLFANQPLSLAEFLLNKEKTGIIAEFKRQSPSKGIINATANVVDVTKAYAAHGASAISVLTDEPFFGGKLDDLAKATVNAVPLLRKDFVVDEYQIVEAKAYGASIVLLIAACLTKKQVGDLTAVAKHLGLSVLLELHDEVELELVGQQNDIIGINNRSLKTFEVNIDRSLQMAEQLGNGVLKVAESGIHKVEDIDLFKQHGYHGFLIGENFMKAADPGKAFESFVQSLK
jgi:indole-3-glycerol phosphate synthase